MKFRIAKKILQGRTHYWFWKLSKIRTPYRNEEGHLVIPSFHDVDIIARARKVFFKHVKRKKKKWNQ